MHRAAGSWHLLVEVLVALLLLGGLGLPCGRFDLKSLKAGGRKVGGLVALAV